MALLPFEGISFQNPGYLCYCNSSINALLSSNHVASSITANHCNYCSFLYEKKTNYSINQSSLRLKEWIGQKYSEFQSTDHQDPSEFMNCLLHECLKLKQLTQSEIISSYKCQKCPYIDDDADSEERFKNIVHLNTNGSSVQDIVSKARRDLEPFMQRCVSCKELNYHQKKQNWLILPSVLIITLHYDQNTPFTEVEPTLRLEIDGVFYGLRSVITHHASLSHITTTIYNSNTGSWIKCDDQSVSINEKPQKGLVFIYDKVNNDDFLTYQPLNVEQSDQGGSSKGKPKFTTDKHSKREKSDDFEENCSKKTKSECSSSQSDQIICKICNKSCTSLLKHFSKQKKIPNCKTEYQKYFPEELKALYAHAEEKIAQSKKNYRKNNPGKVKNSKDKLERVENKE